MRPEPCLERTRPNIKTRCSRLTAPMNFMNGFDEPDRSLIRSHMRNEYLESNRSAQPLSLDRSLRTIADVACVVGIPVFVKRLSQSSRLLVPAFNLLKIFDRNRAQCVDRVFFVLTVRHHSSEQTEPRLAKFGKMRESNDREISQLVAIERVDMRKRDICVAGTDMLVSLDNSPNQ